jgi:hypothetical protein
MSAERSFFSASAPARPSPLVFISGLALTVGLIASSFAVPAAAITAAPITAPSATLVALVVPLSVQTGSSGLIGADELGVATSSNGYLTRMLDAIIDQTVTIALDPMIIVSIRILGSDAPPSAVDWLTRLSQASNETFSLSYADSDVTLGLQAGLSTILEPSGFDFALRPNRFPETAPTPTPAPSTDTGDPLPTTEDLLAWDYTLRSVTWPVGNTVTAVDVEKIVASGVSTTVVTSENTDRASQEIAAGTFGSHMLAVTDSDLSASFLMSVNSSDAQTRQASLSAITESVTTSRSRTTTERSFVVALDRGVVLNPSRLNDSIVALSSTSEFRVSPLSTILGGTTTPATIRDMPHTAARLSIAASLVSAEEADEQFAGVASNPSQIIDERRLRLIGNLAPHWNRYPGGWGVAATEFLAESVSLRSSVRIVESSEITFAADRGMIPITIGNRLDQAATVFVSVRPRTPLLAIDSTPFELEIEPDSQRKALIPAEALSNGTVELVVSIRNSAGSTIGQPTSVTTRVQAGWETPVTFALGVLFVIIFILGIIRTVRRRRKNRLSDSSESGPVNVHPEPVDSDTSETAGTSQ